MDSFECPNSEHLEYFDNTTSTAYWPCPRSVPIASGHVGPDTILPYFDQQLFEPWLAPASPPASDQSSLSRAPSSHTSYNEFEGGEMFVESSSPKNHFLDSRTQSPIFNHSGPASLMDPMGCDPMFDLSTHASSRTPLAPVLSPATVATSGVDICSECCPNKKFSRPYDLTRHINEQHRCPHEDCKEIKFLSAKEKRDHEKSHSEAGIRWRCGTCSLIGIIPKPFLRLEKLRRHLREKHEIPIDLNFVQFQCIQDPCYLGESCGGIYFTSQCDLDEHHRQNHVPSSTSGTSLSGRNYRALHPTPLGENVGVGNAGKRPLDPDVGSQTKRGKAKRNGIVFTDASITQQDMTPSQASTSGPRIDFNPDPPQSPKTLEETLKLSVIDLQTLTKQQKWNSVLAKLDTLHVFPTFDSKQAAIKLRGECSAVEMDEGKMLLTDLINQSKSMTLRDDEVELSDRVKPRTGFHQQVSVHPHPEINALNPKDDADLLILWNTQLLPQFPGIVRVASIEGTYSVALVRHNGINGSDPIIRFRSSGNQGEVSRQIVRQSVQRICETNHCLVLNVQFTQGTLVRLAGGSSIPSILDDPSNDQRFPHERRPWGTPGMGASIGLSRCPHVSATLGGYISVDGRLYMLSVDHFISECSCDDDTNLRSPSICDLSDVRDQLNMKLKELDLQISRSAPDEVPLGQAAGELFPREVDEEVEQYKRFQHELDDNDNFALGRIRYRCGGGMLSLRPSANPRLVGLSHHMDWSLSEVSVKHREGKNLHRHGRIAKPGPADLAKEIMRPEGYGPLCATIGDVAGGEKAYYVGTTSGLREGLVNPALIQYGDEHGNISHEWSMTVPHCEILKDSDFQGDSGAWIISNNNELLGLLWGWDNGNLLFTPIKDVFADITQRMRCHQIKLPEHSPGSKSERSGSLICRMIRESTPEEFIEVEEPNEPPLVTSSLLAPIDIVKTRRRGSSVSNTSIHSVSSLPSLLSSYSSFSDDLNPSMPSPESPPSFLASSLPIRTRPRPLSQASESDWVCIDREEVIGVTNTHNLKSVELDQRDGKPILA